MFISSNIHQIISLSPILILILNIFFILCSIIIFRSHKFTFFITMFGLSSILYVLWHLYGLIPISINSLLYINCYSLICCVLIILISLLVCIFSYYYLEKFFFYREEFYILLLSSILGSFLTVFSNNMLSLFLGVELMSLPVIGLMLYSLFPIQAMQVMLKYIIVSIISSISMLLGIALIYTICGNLNFNSIKMYFLVNDIQDNRILLLGISFLLISCFFKLSLFPLHFWVSDIYKYTYSILLLYITTVIKIAIFSILIKLFFYFPYSQTKFLYIFIEMIAIASIVFGSIILLFQNNIKQFLGYSSIIHMGYVIITLLIIHRYSYAYVTSIIYFIYYVLSNVGLFSILILSELLQNKKNNKVNDLSYYEGFFWKQPKLTIAMTIIFFSFLGLPCTFGFVMKFIMIFISMYYHFWLINTAIFINSGLGIYFYLNMILNLYSNNNTNKNIMYFQKYKKTEFFILLVSVIIIILGIFPNIFMYIINIG